MFNPGAVAAGMSVVLEIEINAEEEGRVIDEIVIETEKEVRRRRKRDAPMTCSIL